MFCLQKSTPNEYVRHGRLLEKITHRGPNAYKLFISILNAKFPNALNVLHHIIYENDEERSEVSIRERNGRPYEPSNATQAGASVTQRALDMNANANANANTNGNSNETEAASSKGPSPQIPSARNKSSLKLAEYELPVYPKRAFTVRKSTRFHGVVGGEMVPAYQMHSRNRGVLFLVNIINFKNKGKRNGADADRDNFIELFRQMGFKIFYYEDLTKDVSAQEISF